MNYSFQHQKLLTSPINVIYDQIKGEDSKKCLEKNYFFLHESCSINIQPVVTKFHNS